MSFADNLLLCLWIRLISAAVSVLYLCSLESLAKIYAVCYICVYNCIVIKALAQYLLEYCVARPVHLSSLLCTLSLFSSSRPRKLFILTVSTVVHAQEKIHVKIHPGVTSNLLFPGLYLQPLLTVGCILCLTACGFPGGQFIPHGPLPSKRTPSQPASVVSSQSPGNKKSCFIVHETISVSELQTAYSCACSPLQLRIKHLHIAKHHTAL